MIEVIVIVILIPLLAGLVAIPFLDKDDHDWQGYDIACGVYRCGSCGELKHTRGMGCETHSSKCPAWSPSTE